MEDMKKCKYCKSEMDLQAKVCPNCRRKQSNVTRNIILGVVGFILFWAFVLTITDSSPVSNNNNTNNSGQNANTNTQQEKFSVIEHSTKNDEYWTYIIGTIKNNTNKNYSYVQIEINLYDADGNLVDSTFDNVNNLEANGTWKFEAMATNEFTTYKIKDIIGW